MKEALGCSRAKHHHGSQSGVTNGGSGVPFTRGTQVVVRNTPVANGELLNQDLGIYGQDSWTIKRLTVNAGLRWESLNAQVARGTSPAGRFVPAREFAIRRRIITALRSRSTIRATDHRSPPMA
jgi:outer membrane receptor protein involved in Fe transport